MQKGIITTVCPRDCYDTCFLNAIVEEAGNRCAIQGDPAHPVTQGFTCPRGAKDVERVFANNRVLHPQLRRGGKPSNRFTQTSWEEALTLISQRLQQVYVNHGPEAILHIEYAGNMGLLTWYFPQRLWYALGATHTDYSICSKSGHKALALHYGASYGLQPEELLTQRLIVFWGFNAAISSPHLWKLAKQAEKENGAVIAVVDPRVSVSAKTAFLHLHPRPGSDVALALGLARYLIEHEYVDFSFLRQWTKGFDELKLAVMKWTPQRVEKATGLDWRAVEHLGTIFGDNRPSATLIGLGMQKSLQGAEAVRAISFIPSLLGYHRGFFYSNNNAYQIDWKYITGEAQTKKKGQVVSQIGLGPLLEEGAFKFVYIYNMNPAVTLPNQAAVRSGLSRDDVFVVVHETHYTGTTDYADVILPAPTFLEKEDVVIPWSHKYVRLSKRVFEPRGESQAETWVMRELAQRLNRREKWLFEDAWKAVQKVLKNACTKESFSKFLEGKTVALTLKPTEVYQTPSRKVEFYSTEAINCDLDPLPQLFMRTMDDNEFIFLTSASRKYSHTQFQEVYGPIPAIVQIHPADAAAHNIESGDIVILSNDLGHVTVEAEVSVSVPRGVVWAPRQSIGLDGKPQNTLISHIAQKVGQGSTFNSTIIRISKS